MKRTLLATAAILLAMASGVAADDPILARQALMKANGKATTSIVPFLKGTAPFDLATAQAALRTYINTADKAPALFPPGSDKGKTYALPAIWANKSDFEARFAKLGADSKAALASVKDEATFKSDFLPVLKNCDGCHDTYRAKDQ